MGPRRSPDAPRVVEWASGALLWRVSLDPNGVRPSTSLRSNRFTPHLDPAGQVIPAWYGATTTKGAIFETVFHGARPADRAPEVMPSDYEGRCLAPVRTIRPLHLVDLATTGLHAIGMSRARLIESRPGRYPWTRSIAARLVAAAPQADGLTWVSRADDTSRSVVLYLPEGRPATLKPDPARESLVLGIGAGLSLLWTLATEARITVWPPDPD